MNDDRIIYGVGETVLDVVFKHDRPLAAVPGGSAFNAMISLGRSVGVKYPEVPIRMITETGDDHIGDIVVNFMKENHVQTDCVTRNPGTQTHISMAFLNQNNDAEYEFYKDHAHARLSPETVSSLNFRADDMLLTSSYFAINPVIREFTSALYHAANAAGAIIYYDINFRRSHAGQLSQLLPNILENISLASVVRASTEDLQIIFGDMTSEQIYQQHIRPFCPLFICTDGGRPLTLFTPDFIASYPVAPIETVSTIGAGDNFNAGFIYSIIDQNLTGSALAAADKTVWDRLIASGQSFSARVCQSLYNYIDEI